MVEQAQIKNQIEVSVVVPIYNNAATIVELCRLVKKELAELKVDFETILVEDCGTDNSRVVIRELCKVETQIQAIFNATNLGQHRSILRGMQLSKGKYIVVMDADLQDNPALIPTLIQSIHSGNDAVYALREGQYQGHGRMRTSFFFKNLIYLLTGLKRTAGTYFIIKKSVKDRILKFSCPHPYITLIVVEHAQQVAYVKGKREQRATGVSAYSFKKRLQYAYYGLECIFYLKKQKILR
ncbi:MAG: glycosyltransferase [Saprospiraceae bacterium]